VCLLPGGGIGVRALEHPGFEFWFSGAELTGLAP